jgi:16S rRNA (uracil1498-N3)-methyltransferase
MTGRFYFRPVNYFYAPSFSRHNVFSLDENESKHCTRVLRHRAGDVIIIINGKGEMAEAVIQSADAKHVMLKYLRDLENRQKRNYRLHLAVAPPKNMSRFEWMLEKCTETGVDEITPLVCTRSERTTLNHTRLEKILTEAMKQSGKAELPVLNAAASYSEFVQRTGIQPAVRLMASWDENIPLLKNEIVKCSPFIILIGPEGDFTPNEILHAVHNGYKPVSLGPARLRIETAAVTACITVSVLHQ